MLSRFSGVQLCATPWTAAHQALLSTGLSKQNLEWVIYIYEFAVHLKHCKSTMLVAPSRLTLCNDMDCSPPGFSVYAILQARILEWVAMLSSRGSSPPRE